jgi:predicted porin
MKKTLIALAALAATSSFAQVTMTGAFRAAVGTAAYGGATSRADLGRVSGAFTLAGTEDLGGGSTASFTIQQGIYSFGTTSAAPSASATQVGDRIASLTVANKDLGSVIVGRDLNGSSQLLDIGNISNLKLVTGFDGTVRSAASAYGPAGQDDSVYFGNVRSNGFAPQNYDTTTDPTGVAPTVTSAASKSVEVPYTVGAVYVNGPLQVGFNFVDYRNIFGPAIAKSHIDRAIQVTGLAANYNFGPARVGAVYQKINDTTDGLSANSSYVLSLNVPVTSALDIGAAYGYRGANEQAAYNADGVTHSAIGLNYALSKRTAVFAGLNRKASNRANDKNDASETNFGLAHTF